MNTDELARQLDDCLEPSGPIVAAFKLGQLATDMLKALRARDTTIQQLEAERDRLREAMNLALKESDSGYVETRAQRVCAILRGSVAVIETSQKAQDSKQEGGADG